MRFGLPQLNSVFKAPENAVIVGLGEGAAIVALYAGALPPHVDIRSADQHNPDVEAARKRAAWASVTLLGLVLLITQDVNATLIGGAFLGVTDLLVKHANAVNPTTGKAGADNSVPADNDVAMPLADYADTAADDPGY